MTLRSKLTSHGPKRCKRLCAFAAITTFLALFAGPSWADPPLQVPIHSCASTAATVTGFVGDFPGTSTGPMRQFLGIPYAASTAGKNRWQPPKDFCWTGNRDTFAAGNFCPQLTPFGNGDEDCLFLNIFTPATGPYARLPVMVFIHGGGWVSGSGYATFQNPVDLVKQNVIVVTINYRLGAFGFLAHPALDNPSTKNTGMYGILDQQAALRWVRKNIGKFGGDPNRVTIFGQSVGAYSVVVHLVSPLSRGLFQSAIIHSGAFAFQTTMSNAEAIGSAFANRAGCSTQKASCLRALAVDTVLANQDTSQFIKLDNVVLKEPMRDSLTAGRFQKVPIINGTTHDEARFFAGDQTLGTGDSCHFKSKITPASYSILLSQQFDGLAPKVIQHYPPGNSDLSANINFLAASTDGAFACNAYQFDLWVAPNDAALYAYQFDDQTSPQTSQGPIKMADGTIFPAGADHAIDLQYLFHLPSPVACGAPYALNAAHQKLRAAMITYWTTFAATGNPNPSSGTQPTRWPPFKAAGKMLSLVAASPVTVPGSGFDADHKCSAFWFTGPP